MLMNVTFLFAVVGFGAADKPSLNEIVSAKKWTKVNEELILTAGGKITTVKANITRILQLPDVDTESSTDAYDSFVWGYRKRAQKYAALIIAYAYKVLLEQQDDDTVRYATNVVKKSLLKFNSRLMLLSNYRDLDHYNEFQTSHAELTRAQAISDVLNVLSKTKDEFHRIVDDQCVPNPAPKRNSSLRIIGPKIPPRKPHRRGNRVTRKILGLLKKIKHQKGSKNKPMIISAYPGGNNMQTDTAFCNITPSKENVYKCEAPNDKSSAKGSIKSSHVVSKMTAAAGTDQSNRKRCNLEDMYGAVADKVVYDIFLENFEKPFSDLKEILRGLFQTYSIEDPQYSNVPENVN